MKKIIIKGFKLNDQVLITSYVPPLKGRVIDMYEIESTMVADEKLRSKYPEQVPIFEIMMEGGKLLPFVKDVVKKA